MLVLWESKGRRKKWPGKEAGPALNPRRDPRLSFPDAGLHRTLKTKLPL